jgi:predicted dinucleotide-utilizing enzyme
MKYCCICATLEKQTICRWSKLKLIWKIMSKIRVGIVGFGALGQYLIKQLKFNIAGSQNFELAFVHNRKADKIEQSKLNISENKILRGDLNLAFEHFITSGQLVDLVVEASHPDTIKESGAVILNHSDLMITSLTALAESKTYNRLKELALQRKNSIYIPSGAGWGFQDIKKMADLQTLTGLSVSMKFHYDALKLNEPLRSILSHYVDSDDNKDQVIFQGSVRDLAMLAPNNVNTMCGLALAGHNIGFDLTQATLIASKTSHEHEVHIQISGPNGYTVESRRINPALPGAVTGSMTFSSFLSSLLAYKGGHRSGLCFV